MRVIDADELALEVKRWFVIPDNRKTMKEAIDNAPTLDYEPVRHGEWIQMVDAITNRKVGYRCSECGLILRKKYDYCNCGAKMGKGDA